MKPLEWAELEALERLAKDATPGEWHCAFTPMPMNDNVGEPPPVPLDSWAWVETPHRRGSLYITGPLRMLVSEGSTRSNHRYICAANPEKMLRLVAHIRSLEAQLKRERLLASLPNRWPPQLPKPTWLRRLRVVVKRRLRDFMPW